MEEEACTDADCGGTAPESTFLVDGPSDDNTATGAVFSRGSLVSGADSAISIEGVCGSWTPEALAARILARALPP